MASVLLKGRELVISKLDGLKLANWELPIAQIDEIRVIERSSFYHPIAGLVLGIGCLGVGVYFLGTALWNHWPPILFFAPKGGLIWLPLLIGIFTLWHLGKQKKIPWLILHYSGGRMKFPLDTMSMSEAKAIAEDVCKIKGTA